MKQSNIFRISLAILCLLISLFLFLLAFSEGFTDLVEDVFEQSSFIPIIAVILFIAVNFWGVILWFSEGKPSRYNEWVYSGKQGKFTLAGIALFILSVIVIAVTAK